MIPEDLRRYASHFRPHTGALVLAAVLLSVNAAIPGAVVLLLQHTLDEVLGNGRVDQLGLLCLAFAGLYVLAGALRLARARITKGVAWQVTSDLRRRLFAHTLTLTDAQQASTGARIAALTTEVDELQYGVSAAVTAFRNPLTLAGLAVTAIVLAPSLAPWALLLVPAVVLPARWGGRRLRAIGGRVRQTRSDLVDELQQQLTGLATTRDFAAEADAIARIDVLDERDRSARLRLEVERVLPSAAVQAVAAAAIGVLLWFGGQQVIAGDLQAGELVGFAVALGLMNRPLGGLSEVWSLLQRSLAALDNVYATLATASAVEAPDDPLPVPAGALTVRWEGVTATYGDEDVLQFLHLEARPGERLAIVGASGAGKTTLLRLVGRHLDPTAGRVTLNGVNVRDLDPAELRRQIGVVRQEDFLFARSVADNVAFGRTDATREAIERACRRAGAHDFVKALPQGYDTPVDELGQRLSGGERQRICLARALLSDARILLLDEATNQIDAANEREILDVLETVRDGKTIVMVTHDLAAVQSADRIVVLQDGRIVEDGTHAALLRANGPYADLWRVA